MKVTLGRIVMLTGTSIAPEVPAIVTAIHSETCINATAFLPNGNVSGFSSVIEQGSGVEGNVAWTWPTIAPAQGDMIAGESLMGGFNVLSLLGGDFGAIVGPLLVMLYNANKGRIESSADRVLTPPQSAINYILDRFGIKDPEDRAQFAEALRVWGDKGGDALVLLSDLIAKKAGA